MRIILKEYLASLKERGDLDKSVLPNLLSEIGLRVLNSAMLGTRQHGVDIAAVGKIKGQDKKRFLYLFCIKAGNVTRRDWDSNAQSVRPELNEIRDIYLRSNVAAEYQSLPVKICLVCGGELDESVLVNWAGYTDSHTTDRISYEEWNGDRIAELMMKSLLARELLDDKPRRSFQKAVAMVNEPKACYEYARAFLTTLMDESDGGEKATLLKLRQSYICTHAVIAWGVDADNLGVTYEISELALLLSWNVVRGRVIQKKNTKHVVALRTIFDQFLQLYLGASELYFEKVLYPYVETRHGLSTAVGSKESADINLKLFDLIGKLAMKGIWIYYLSAVNKAENPSSAAGMKSYLDCTMDRLVLFINSNPALSAPLKDDHMIEIALVMYLAQLTNSEDRFVPWIKSIANRTTFALLANSQYPTCLTDYSDLLSHPASPEQSYLNEACAGSILYPYLYLWMLSIGGVDEVESFSHRLKSKIPNCTHQVWFPDEDTDELIWKGDRYHGVCVPDLSPELAQEKYIELLEKAVESCPSLYEISAIRLGMVPLFLAACLHFRLPIPPNYWMILNE